MKKLIGVAVAMSVALAFSVYAGTTTPTEKSTVEKVKVTETSTPEGKEVKATVKEKAGDVAKETVTFSRYEQNGDWIYVMKDNKEIRLKHTLHENAKKDMLGFKKGDAVTVTSTYPLTKSDLATVLKIEKNAPVTK